MPGEDFVEAVLWFDQISSERRERRSSLHPPSAGPAAIGAPRGARAWDRKQSIQHHDEAKNYLSITQSRENKPFISVCHQLEAGMVGFAPRSSPGRAPGRVLGWALSVCPGFPVLGVLLALLQAQRGSSFCLGQGSEGGQVGG